MRMWYKGPDGKEASVEMVEGLPVVLRYYGEVKFGRFVKIVNVPGRSRWNCPMICARTQVGTEFTGPMFWFSPVVSAEETQAFEKLFRSVAQPG